MKLHTNLILLFSLLLAQQVASAQNAPVAANDTFTVSINQTATLPVTNNDYDVDGEALTLQLITLPSNGSANVSGLNVSYTPNSGFSGTDMFSYSICDPTSRCDTASVWIIVDGSNLPPVANDDYYTITANAQAILSVANNDFDTEAAALSISILSGPTHGVANINGTNIIYNPTTNFSGNDTIVYNACDPFNLCDTATVYIYVTTSNQPPTVVVTDVFFSDTIRYTQIDIGASDPNNDSLYIQNIVDTDSSNSLGNLSAIGNTLYFQRNQLSCGTETYTYQLCDALQCFPHQIAITISCPSDIFHTQGFSPNGDGLNDKLVFTGLEYFGPSQLKVFNRNGSIVYESNDYRNDWDGTFIDSGKPLPDGTYYYMLVLADGRKFVDFLMLNR